MKGTVFTVAAFPGEFGTWDTGGADGASGDAFEVQFSIVGTVEKEGCPVECETVEGGAAGDKFSYWRGSNLFGDIFVPFSVSPGKETVVTLVGSDGKGPDVIVGVTVEGDGIPVASP